VRNDLVPDVTIKGMNPTIDLILRNAWGVAFTPSASPFWVADNASGCATLYDGTGVKIPTQVAIPLPDNSVPSTACQPASTQTNPLPSSPAAPTGLVWNPTTNPTTGFLVPDTSIPAVPAVYPANGKQAECRSRLWSGRAVQSSPENPGVASRFAYAREGCAEIPDAQIIVNLS